MPQPLPLSYCAREVRQRDPDRYLCTLFAPAGAREAWFALFAFHLELRAIPGKVSEEMLGFIRFAWWREALDEIYSGAIPRPHPVVEALAEAVRAFQLPREWLDTLVAAHEKRLINERQGVAGMDAYCRDTSGTLLGLCGSIAGETLRDAAIDAGATWGWVELARMLPEATGQSEVTRAQAIEAAQAALAKALPLRNSPSSPLMPFLQANAFFLKRLRSNKSTATPLTRVLLALQLWLGKS